MFKKIRPKERGFTLIELLIVVAILGILAAVVIPNVGRSLGRGEKEARRAEFHDLGTAMTALMTKNNLSAIPTTGVAAVTTPTNLLDAFPVTAAECVPVTCKVKDAAGTAYNANDKGGYLLYSHDKTGGDGVLGNPGPLVNYVNIKKTTYFYTFDADGTVHQWKDAAKTGGEYTD